MAEAGNEFSSPAALPNHWTMLHKAGYTATGLDGLCLRGLRFQNSAIKPCVMETSGVRCGRLSKEGNGSVGTLPSVGMITDLHRRPYATLYDGIRDYITLYTESLEEFRADTASSHLSLSLLLR